MKKNSAMCAKAAEFPVDVVDYFSGKHEDYKLFLSSKVSDDQLSILKEICNKLTIGLECEFLKFLSTIFLYVPIKHPIKSFTMRYVVKNKALHDVFSEILSTEIERILSKTETDLQENASILCGMVAPCFENFPPGVEAIRKTDVQLFGYLSNTLTITLTVLEESQLSPTSRNELYSLVHMSLQLILQLLQQARDDRIPHLKKHFSETRSIIKKVFLDEEVPMDSKTLGGIVFVLMHLLENGKTSWIDVLLTEQNQNYIINYLKNDAEKLALYSALLTLAPEEDLQAREVAGTPAIMKIATEVLNIGDRTSSDSTYSLLVSRTVVQISKYLRKIADMEVGSQLVGKILDFVWSHLEHYMDSVRHLASQSLAQVVEYYSNLPAAARKVSMDKLMDDLSLMDRGSKSFYVCVGALVRDCGAAALLNKLPNIAACLLGALSQQALQSSAFHCIDSLMMQHLKETDPETINSYWVTFILEHVAGDHVDSTVLDLLKTLLKRAIKHNHEILKKMIPKVLEVCDTGNEGHLKSDLKSALFLLSVIRCSDNFDALNMEKREGYWKGLISYRMLKTAAVLAVEETRVLALSIVVCSLRTTEPYSEADLAFIIHYLKYNMDAQSSRFRQSLLSHVDKFLTRFVDSYKASSRRKDVSTTTSYELFLARLVQLCFDSLKPGLNHRRREFSLGLLLRIHKLDVDKTIIPWKAEYADRLIHQLGDTFETTIDAAYQLLGFCPNEFFNKNASNINTELTHILRQARSVKPNECVTASFKLLVTREKRKEDILAMGESLLGFPPPKSEPVDFIIVSLLLKSLSVQLNVARTSIVRASVEGPMHGVLRCLVEMYKRIDVQAITGDTSWTDLTNELITTLSEVNAAVGGVVNSDSPEGYLPDDNQSHKPTVASNGAGSEAELDDEFEGDFDIEGTEGQQAGSLAAQRVLLCAWRSVKESSLLLGEMVSRLSISGEGVESGTLTQHQVQDAGEHFTRLLLDTKHRGAFEQGYTAFSALVKRVLQCSSPQLHELPRRWLATLTSALTRGDGATLSATRRSAGVPFMIQALVTSEIHVNQNPKMFHTVVTSLLAAARAPRTAPSDDRRTHCLNILRALYRNTTLGEVAASRVGEGLMVAIDAFDSEDWSERNSATLLFSALVVRVFGVQRARSLSTISPRNCLTGRVFFQRYPYMYDYMLDRLQKLHSPDGSERKGHQLLPSLYPILLILARLYPSALEGTVSNLKLVQFIPLVQRCARSRVLKTRELAAQAMVPLFTPDQIGPYLLEMTPLLTDSRITTNYRHGILLLLIRIIDTSQFPRCSELESCLSQQLSRRTGLVAAARGGRPCFMLLAEYAALVNQILRRYPTVLKEETQTYLIESFKEIIYNDNWRMIDIGRDYALGNCNYVLFILLCKLDETELPKYVIKSLTSKYDDVVTTALKYLLLAHGYDWYSETNSFLSHLNLVTGKQRLLKLVRENEDYVKLLAEVLKTSNNVKSKTKATKLLSLELDTQEVLLTCRLNQVPEGPVDIINKLIQLISSEPEHLRHMYLDSLLKYTSPRLNDLNKEALQKVAFEVFLRAAVDEMCSEVVLRFIADNVETVFRVGFEAKERLERFGYYACMLGALATLLEADLRQRASDAVAAAAGASARVLPSKAADLFCKVLESVASDDEEVVALYTTVALLDFRPHEHQGLYDIRKNKAFDPRPPHAEEILWTINCSKKIKALLTHSKNDQDDSDDDDCDNTPESNNKEKIDEKLKQTKDYFKNIISSSEYAGMEQLCRPSFKLFTTFLNEDVDDISSIKNFNYKVRIFIDNLFFE